VALLEKPSSGTLKVKRLELKLFGRKKTGLDYFMAVCEFGNESEDNKTGFYCTVMCGKWSTWKHSN
jgi:hypothetical protein